MSDDSSAPAASAFATSAAAPFTPAEDLLLRRAQALGITLRRSRESDTDAFVAMMSDESVYPHTLQLPYASEAYWRERLKRPGDSGNADTHLVAEHDGRVVASTGIFAAAPNVRRRHAMGLGITIARAWQGRGLGDLLMTAIVHHADQWLGIVRLELTVFADNARAIALYRKHCFNVEGTMRAYALRDGAYADVLAMARLNPRMTFLPLSPSAGAQAVNGPPAASVTPQNVLPNVDK